MNSDLLKSMLLICHFTFSSAVSLDNGLRSRNLVNKLQNLNTFSNKKNEDPGRKNSPSSSCINKSIK